MPSISKPQRPRRRSSKAKARPRTSKRTGTRKTVKRKAAKPRQQKTAEATFIYECTRPECGYRILRDEKGELEERRYDLKCPKCHNKEFKCLGRGDLPGTYEPSVPESQLDLSPLEAADLGSDY